MEQNYQKIIDTITPLLTKYSLKVLGAIAILLIGWIVARWFAKKTRGLLSKSKKLDTTLIPIIANLVKISVLIVTILAVMSNFGIQTTSIIAVLGAGGLAIGLALQGTLSNVASGVMLLVFRPFNVGDFVVIGSASATVDEIGLFLTKLHTPDNINIYLPNSKIWGNEINNYSQNDNRRINLIFGIGYDDDMDKAMAIIKEEFDQDERILKDPAPLIAVSDLGDSSVNILARPWTQKGDFFQVQFDITKKVKERFDQEGINIPFPQRDVHLYNASGS